MLQWAFGKLEKKQVEFHHENPRINKTQGFSVITPERDSHSFSNPATCQAQHVTCRKLDKEPIRQKIRQWNCYCHSEILKIRQRVSMSLIFLTHGVSTCKCKHLFLRQLAQRAYASHVWLFDSQFSQRYLPGFIMMSWVVWCLSEGTPLARPWRIAPGFAKQHEG